MDKMIKMIKNKRIREEVYGDAMGTKGALGDKVESGYSHHAPRMCSKSFFYRKGRKGNTKDAKSQHVIFNPLRSLRKTFAPLRFMNISVIYNGKYCVPNGTPCDGRICFLPIFYPYGIKRKKLHAFVPSC